MHLNPSKGVDMLLCVELLQVSWAPSPRPRPFQEKFRDAKPLCVVGKLEVDLCVRIASRLASFFFGNVGEGGCNPPVEA